MLSFLKASSDGKLEPTGMKEAKRNIANKIARGSL